MLYNFNRIIGDTVRMAVDGTSTSMASGFGDGVRGFMINANTAVHFAVATTPVATSNGTPFLPANETNYFNCSPGQKVAAITAPTNGLVTSTVGSVFITPFE